MKIILSRKGFDSGTGRVASPIFPDGTMVSLPIPTERSEIRFCDIRYSGGSLGSIVADLTNRAEMEKCDTHLDPDLRASALRRSPGWKPLFGQIAAAQTHLDNQGVAVGDLFLFFGWFRRVERMRGRWTYVAGARDLHVLFGWLQVGEIIRHPDQRSAPPWARYHPHFNFRYTGNNTVYAASEHLCFDGQPFSVRGGGAFGQYDDELCLTVPGAKRSLWQLPAFFYPGDFTAALTYHRDPKNWRAQGDTVYLQTVGRGQEFVLDTSRCPRVAEWAKDVIVKHAEQLPQTSDWRDGLHSLPEGGPATKLNLLSGEAG